MKKQFIGDFFNDWDEYCFHCNPKHFMPLMTADEYAQFEMYHQEHLAEVWAENAWLRAAEAPTDDDLAFEQWEQSRGCY